MKCKEAILFVFQMIPSPMIQTMNKKGLRPWLVVSAKELSEISPFAWVIPFTSTIRDYPLVLNWETLVPTSQTNETLLVQQLTCVDIQARKVEFVEHVTIPQQVNELIHAILGE